MGKYTTTLYDISLMLANNNTLNSDLVELVREEIFSRINYNFYSTDNKLKKDFETLFVKTYFFAPEIGFETLAQFVFNLETELNTIMPQYADMFLTLNQNHNLTEYINNTNYSISRELKDVVNRVDDIESNSEEQTTATNSNEIESNSQQLFSDQPQTTVVNNAYATNLTKDEEIQQTNAHATNNNKIKNTATNIYDTTTNQNETTKMNGKNNVDLNKIIKEYRENIININKLIIDDLRKLFLYIY